MPVEDLTPIAFFTVAGIGPYGIGYSYDANALTVSVLQDEDRITLASDDFTVSPISSSIEGDVYLTPAAAVLYAGAQLTVERVTPDEQGWIGSEGERERGLERQLDRIVRGQQELRRGVNSAFRLDTPVESGVSVPGRAILFTENGFEAGPSADEIASAQEHAEASAAILLLMQTATYAVTPLANGEDPTLTYDAPSNTFTYGIPAGDTGGADLIKQTSATDSTAGSLLTVGAFGLGELTASPLIANLNAQDTPAGLYRYDATTTGTKPVGVAADGVVLILRGKDSTSFIQHLYSGQGIGMHTRACVTGSLLSWVQVYTGNEVSSNADFTVDPTKLATRATIKALLTGYESAETSWATGAKHTFAHGLGARPKRFQVVLRCTTAQSPYVVDEEIAAPGLYTNGGVIYGVGISVTTTSIICRIPRDLYVPNDTTGFVTLLPASWRLVARASL